MDEKLRQAILQHADQEFLLSVLPEAQKSPLSMLGMEGEYRGYRGSTGHSLGLYGAYRPPTDAPLHPLLGRMARMDEFFQGDLPPDAIAYGPAVAGGRTASTLPHEMMHRGLARLARSPEGQADAIMQSITEAGAGGDHVVTGAAEARHWPADEASDPDDSALGGFILNRIESLARTLMERQQRERIETAKPGGFGARVLSAHSGK